MSQASPVHSLSPSPQGSPFVSRDPDFEAVLGDSPRLARVLETDAHEGPVYAADEDALYFTTLPRPGDVSAPRVDIERLQLDGERFPLEPERLTVVRPSANMANGMTLDREGRLVVSSRARDRSMPPSRASTVRPAPWRWSSTGSSRRTTSS